MLYLSALLQQKFDCGFPDITLAAFACPRVLRFMYFVIKVYAFGQTICAFCIKWNRFQLLLREYQHIEPQVVFYLQTLTQLR